jgi:hypothetical protein
VTIILSEFDTATVKPMTVKIGKVTGVAKFVKISDEGGVYSCTCETSGSSILTHPERIRTHFSTEQRDVVANEAGMEVLSEMNWDIGFRKFTFTLDQAQTAIEKINALPIFGTAIQISANTFHRLVHAGLEEWNNGADFPAIVQTLTASLNE